MDDYGSVGASEIIGAAEIIGALSDADFSELVSGSDKMTVKRLSHLRQAGGVAVVDRPAQHKRRLIMGIPPTTLPAAGTSVNVETKPQQKFRTERVVVPSNIAFDISFEDIKVANRSQLISEGELPAATFTEVARDCYVEFDTADAGILISFRAKSISGADVIFRGTLLGTAAIV